jgi:multicomponent Na+:H+ antiporter subunit G
MILLAQGVALFFLVAGTLFSVIGIAGFLRMPDVYTRLHASGKVSVFGAVFLLIAAAILTPLEAWKGLLLIFFVLLVSPSVSHSIASAAYKTGIPMKKSSRDDLRGKMERSGNADE